MVDVGFRLSSTLSHPHPSTHPQSRQQLWAIPAGAFTGCTGLQSLYLVRDGGSCGNGAQGARTARKHRFRANALVAHALPLPQVAALVWMCGGAVSTFQPRTGVAFQGSFLGGVRQ